MRVFGEPAAGDMSHALDFDLGQEREHRFGVDSRRLEQGVAKRARSGDARDRPREVRTALFEDLANERETIGVRPARREPDERVALHDAATVDRAAFFDDADGEARQVVLAGHERVWMLGSLTADQRTARLLAAGGNALDHVACHREVAPLPNSLAQ